MVARNAIKYGWQRIDSDPRNMQETTTYPAVQEMDAPTETIHHKLVPEQGPRGEALLARMYSSDTHYRDDHCTGLTDVAETPLGWHVLWTRSNSEQLVRDQLVAKDYEIFLPMVNQWFRGSARLVRRAPMFKGYLFLRHRIDKTAYLDISNTRGLVHILGARWNLLALVPDEEMASLKRAVDSDESLLPHPYLKVGTRVRIIRGVLTNAQGILVRTELANGLLVISVGLLQRSVAVKVNCADVEPI